MIEQKKNWLLVVSLVMVVGTSCVSADPQLLFNPGGGLLGSPTTTTGMAQAGSAEVSSSESYVSWVSASTSSFSGSGGFLTSEHYEMSDAMLELGVARVNEEAK